MNRKTFRVDLGDSTHGPIGMVVCVKAADDADALANAAQTLNAIGGVSGRIPIAVPPTLAGRIDYVNVYVNAENIDVDDIYDVEEDCVAN